MEKGIEISDEYANWFVFFYRVLEVLADDAETQCEGMGNFNVAWELKVDALYHIPSILELAEGRLSDEQATKLKRLLELVNEIPSGVTNVPNVRSEHIRSMKNPCWDQIRRCAKDLIHLFESEFTLVKDFLGMEDGQA
jgi:hypothetical protein